MIQTLIHLLIVFVVLVVIWYIVRLGAGHFGLPAPIIQIIGLILGLIFLVYALQAFGIVAPGSFRLP